MAVVIAIDAGTTGVRAIAFDRSGRAVASSYREFTQYFPRPGWVEHDAIEIWEAVQEVLGNLAAQLAEQRSADVVAIGITNQRETVVVWDRRTGEPRHRAIVWQDRRTAGTCDALRETGHLDLIRRKTGLVLDPYFSATKLGWLFTHGGVEPSAGTVFGTVDSWVLWNLTGGAVHATDPSNASRTLLYDIGSLAWDGDLCALFGVPEHVLPEVHPSSGRFGVTVEGVAGFGAGIPVSGIAGDQQAALFGQACFEPGMTKNTYGTGSFVLMNVGPSCPEPVEGLLTTVAWTIPATGSGASGELVTHYALEGAIFVTGAAVQWLRDGLGIIDSAAEIGPLAETVPDTGGVVLVPAFTGLGSPWWDPYARGTIVGITRGTTRAHLARAVVEAMAYQTRDVVEAMSAAAGSRIKGLRVDGGASVMPLLLQVQADQLGCEVSRPVVGETTALGAAYLAGLAEGFWDSLEDISDNWALDISMRPASDPANADRLYGQWRRAVDRARAWAAE
ncbi:MAG: glycerol kinase GlpK [Acidimicrobiales bacterium]|nr:glycerol kinase GlpK [Acidimicrobiales bacterium]